MKIADVRAKTEDELKKELMDLRKEQFNLRFQRSTGQLEGVARIREARRTIARIKTVNTERAKGVVVAAKAAPAKKSAKTAAPKATAAKKKKETKE
jgi:large subunit ribosomal protein L29